MAYKQPPNPTIEAEGGIEVHINNFFAKRDLPYTYGDVTYWKNHTIGGKTVSIKKQCKELGDISRQALYNWHKKIDALHDTSRNKHSTPNMD